jgi:hypothetical protein
MFSEVIVGPQAAVSDNTKIIARGGRTGEMMISELQGRYYENCYRGNLFIAHAIVTAPVIYTTAAGTGGPLIWNNSTSTNVVLLAASIGVTTVTTVAAALGITGNSAQTAAPTSTTAIDSNKNLKIGGVAPLSTAYRVGTPASAGNFFMPFGKLSTGALTVDNTGIAWVDLGGCVVCPPNCWVSVAASATASTTVAQIGLIYAEVPV